MVLLLGETFEQNEKYSLFTEYQDKVGGVAYNRESLYNGNIAAMATSIRHFGDVGGFATQSMNYRYDQLHRIAAAGSRQWNPESTESNKWQATGNGAGYQTSYTYDGNGNIQNLQRRNQAGQLIDKLKYTYAGDKKNQLLSVDELATGSIAEEGLGNATHTYEYDEIGNLVRNQSDGIQNIIWNIQGKVEQVTRGTGVNETVISYRYDASGNRIIKQVTKGLTDHINYYLRDASGNVMAIYEKKTDQNVAIKEIPIYGSSRLGQYRPKQETKPTALGQRVYEFSNHLGNVLVTLSDHKVPQTDGTYASVVVSASDYYPFGMAMAERTYSNSKYRYGFNGKENDTDFGEGKTDFGARFYSSIIGRWFATDPLEFRHADLSTYHFVSNNPILKLDPDGRDGRISITKEVIDGKNHFFINYETVFHVFGEELNSELLIDGKKTTAGELLTKRAGNEFQTLIENTLTTMGNESGQMQYEIDGNVYTFNMKVDFKIVSEKSNEAMIEATGKKLVLDVANLSEEVKNDIGFKEGDNTFRVSDKSPGYGSRSSSNFKYTSLAKGGKLTFGTVFHEAITHTFLTISDIYGRDNANIYYSTVINGITYRDILLHNDFENNVYFRR